MNHVKYLFMSCISINFYKHYYLTQNTNLLLNTADFTDKMISGGVAAGSLPLNKQTCIQICTLKLT